MLGTKLEKKREKQEEKTKRGNAWAELKLWIRIAVLADYCVSYRVCPCVAHRVPEDS